MLLDRAKVFGRPQILEGVALDEPQWRMPEAFEDGHALSEAVCEHELEGVVAKRLHEPYHSGERRWIKVKNRSYWRYELEREGAIRSRTQRTPRAPSPAYSSTC
jgi:ATP-dependent DNA ligase